jgi:DNA (cytosine-5)-methyltransferase 1
MTLGQLTVALAQGKGAVPGNINANNEAQTKTSGVMTMIKYGSVCSGVEAATAAWHSLGWRPQWFSEIEKFPSAVLKHHYPSVPNRGDMTNFKEWPDEPIDVLVGGTPCQSFSVAGLRKGLDDPRGNLMLTYLAIAERYAPKWIVWENVPGVLSSNRGRDFGTFLGALGQLGYGFAYRVLDAQYFGVAQRRKRVFVVGYLGSWQRAAAVLFERDSLQGNIAPRREKGEKVAPTVTTGAPFSRTGNESVECEAIVAQCLTTRTGSAFDPFMETMPVTTGALCARTGQSISVQDASQSHLLPVIAFPAEMSGTQSATTVNLSPALSVKHTIAFSSKQQSMKTSDNVANTLSANDYKEPQAVAIGADCFNGKITGAVAATMTTQGSSPTGSGPTVMVDKSNTTAVRRLTPIECERLQGFPDNYTDIRLNDKQTPDGPRYKAMGNSMAVPVMRWIGERINMVEDTE